MKLQNGEVYGAVSALAQLADKELPVKVSYWLARLANKLDGEFKAIDKVRAELIKKHGKEQTESRGDFTINPKDENWEKFSIDFNDLMMEETEVDIEPVKLPIKLPETVDDKPLTIKLNVLAALEKFVEIEA